MVEGNASMYLGSPRMAEEVIGEKVTLEEMGGARMHATVSGCGDNLAVDDADAIEQAKHWFSYLPVAPGGTCPPACHPEAPARLLTRVGRCPPSEAPGYDMHRLIDGLVDADSFFEVKPLCAPELIVGFGRLDGHAVGIVANNPAPKGGVLFVDSADKAARFIWLCDAFNVPLLFLADVPGFMIGTAGRAPGHHPPRGQDDHRRHRGHRAEDLRDRPQGLRRRAVRHVAGRPSTRSPRSPCPTAKIAVMGPEAAVNAVFANKIAAIDDPDERAAFVAERRAASTRPTSTCCAWRQRAGDRRRRAVRRRCATSSSAASPPPTPATGSGSPSATGCRRYEADPRAVDLHFRHVLPDPAGTFVPRTRRERA